MDSVLRYSASVFIAYLLGSLNFSIIISRLFYKKDIREFGSGNAGSTNAYRMMGGSVTIAVMLGDLLKGIAAVLVAGYILKPLGADGVVGVLLAGLAAVAGHSLPVYFGFKGGKGVLTSAAVLGALDFRILIFLLIVFIVVALLTRYVSLASVCAAIALPIGIAMLHGMNLTYLLFGVLITLAVILLHRDNIKRLLKGEERRFSFKKK